MKRRNIVRLVSFLSAVIVFLGGVIIKGYNHNNQLKLEISNSYSKSINDFSASINNISLILKKVRYATTAPQLSRYASELLTEAEISKNALSQLPSSAHLSSLNRFLSQAGNYAFAVCAKLYKGEEIPRDFVLNISKLSQTADKISEIVNTVKIDFDNPDYWGSEIEQEFEDIDPNLSDALQKIEGEFSDYPTLLYDGPYSDHILSAAPSMLENAEEITKEEAAHTASNFLGNVGGALEYAGESVGKIETYRFFADGLDIEISKKGGHVVYMRKSRQVQESKLSYNQAVALAKKFLDQKALYDFAETYYFTDEGVCVINFAKVDGETVCYTDLIKVGVAMDTGDIMLYEASGYISNHKDRAFPTVAYTAEQARQKVSYDLSVLKVKIALVPTKKGREERCYEFYCVDGDTEVLVYINVLTLEEEELFILIKGDGGTLVK